MAEKINQIQLPNNGGIFDVQDKNMIITTADIDEICGTTVVDEVAY